MADKKSWRDYSGAYSDDMPKESGSKEKTGTWRDYTGDKSTEGVKTYGSWRDYGTFDAAGVVGKNVVGRVNKWLAGHNLYIAENQKRYSGRKGTYEDAYVSDSAQWLDNVTRRKSKLDADYDAIISYLDENEQYLDAGWVKSIRETLKNCRDDQGKIVDIATKDNEYWLTFAPTEYQQAQGYTAEKVYTEWQTGLQQYESDMALDIPAAEQELAQLKADRDAYLADRQASREQAQKEESIWDKLGRWMGNTSDTSLPVYYTPTDNTANTTEYDAQISALETKIARAKNLQQLAAWSSVSGNADFAEKSQYVSNVEYGLFGKPEFTDNTYAYINNPTVDDKRPLGGGTVTARSIIGADYANYKADSPTRNSESYYELNALNQIKPEEVAIYNYYYATEGPEKANAYLELLINTFKDRKYAEAYENAYMFGREHPFWGSIASVVTSLGSGLEYLGDVVRYGGDKIFGKDAQLDKNEAALTTNAIRGAVSDTVDWEIGGWDAFDFVYNTTMSGVDSLTAGLAFGSMGGAVLGLSAAAQGVNDALDRGMSSDQAFWNGLFSGVFEGLFESVSIGNFNALKEIAPNGIKDIAKNIGKSMLVNASEETATEIANIVYDTLANGEFANYTLEELRNGAWKQVLAQVLEAGASGALMGIGMSAAGSTIGNAKANRQAVNNYGNKTNTLIQQGLENDANSRSYQLAQKYQQQVEGKNGKKGKTLTGQQIRNLLAANQEQITAKDTNKIQQAAEMRLAELGQTEDVPMIAELATKFVTGQKLTSEEKRLLVHSKYGTRVVNELTPKNIASGDYTTGWAEEIGTQQVNATAYNAKQIRNIVEAMANGENSAAYQSLEDRVDTLYTTSESGQAAIHESGEAISLDNVEVVSINDDGTMTLNVDGKEVSTADIDFADDSQSYLYAAVSRIENITAGDAQAIIRGYDPSSGQAVGEYLNGIDEAYTYGYHGYSEADMKAGTFTQNLTAEQAKGAYLLGQAAKKSDKSRKTEAIKRMRTAVEAETEKAKAEGKETPKAKGMTITYRQGSKVVDFGKAGLKLTAKQKAAPAIAKVMHDMGLGTNFELFASYVNKSGVRVFLDEDGVERKAYSGVYRMKDGTIRIDLNAYNGRGLTLNAMSHELTHFIKQWSASKYDILAEYLVNTYEKTGMSMHDRVMREQARLKDARGEDVSYNEAYDEVVANAMSKMLDDGKVMERLNEMMEVDMSLAKKLWEGLKKILNKFFWVYENESALFHDAADLMELKAEFEQMQKLWAAAFVEASENFRANLVASEIQTLAEAGIGFDADTKIDKRFGERYSSQEIDIDTDADTDYDGDKKKTEQGDISDGRREKVSHGVDAESSRRVGKENSRGEGSARERCERRIKEILRQKTFKNDAESTPGRGRAELKENREAFESRSRRDGLLYAEVGGVAVAFQVAPKSSWNENAKTAAEKIAQCGFDVVVFTKEMQHNYNGVTETSVDGFAFRHAGNLTIFISSNLDIDGMETAYHEAFHAARYGMFSKYHEKIANIIASNIDIESEAFSRFISAIGDLYAYTVSDISSGKFAAEIIEEFYAWYVGKAYASESGDMQVDMAQFSDVETIKSQIDEVYAQMEANADKALPGLLAGQLYSSQETDADKKYAGVDTSGEVNYHKENADSQEVDGNERREETREAFLRRASKTLPEVDERGSLAFGYRHYYSQLSPEIQAAKEGLTNLSIPVVVFEQMEGNKDGITTVYRNDGLAIPGVAVFIHKDATVDALEIVGHEGYHYLRGSDNRDAYDEVLAANIDFASKAFIDYVQKYVGDIYFAEAVEIGSKEWTTFIEEIFAYITGDIHNGDPKGEVHKFLRDYDAVKAAWDALIKKQSTSGDGQTRYSSQETDADGFQEYDIVSAVYTIRNESAKRGHDLVEIGSMPVLYRDLFGLSGVVYVSNEHLYQNMVSRDVAIAEGRYKADASADYHNLGEAKVIDAIEQFQDPLVIMESLKDYNEPRLVAILDEKGNDGENLIAVMELYSERRPYGVSQKRNHVLITIYEKNSLPDYIEKTVDKGRILHIKKGSPQIRQAGLQLAGEISEKTLKNNIARFNKKVKAFKEQNGIRYSSQETDLDSGHETDNISNRDLLANALEGITQNSIEYGMIQDYKNTIELLNKYEDKLDGLNAEIRKMLFDRDTPRDSKRLKELQEEAKRIAAQINRHDKRLLSLEASEPLRKVLERERKKATQKTKAHVQEILQNKKMRAEQTEMRQKIRRVIRELDKLLNRGTKKRNVKEDMKGFVSKALELAEYLFTDHISNDELIRNGIDADIVQDSGKARLLKETEEILAKLYDEADSLTAEEIATLDAKRKANEAKMKDLLTAQRNRRLDVPVYDLFNDLLIAYRSLQNSSQDAVKAAYNDEVERLLQTFVGDADTDRSIALKNMRVADMTTEELTKLYNAYTMVLTTVRNANKFHVKGMAETIEQMATRVATDFGSRRIPDKKLAIAVQKISNKIGWSYEKLYYALDRIGSEAFTQLVMNLADSENTVMQDIIEAAAFRDQIVEKYGFNNWAVNKEIDREFMDNSGKKFKLTLGQLMSLYAYSRRKGAWDHIEYGGFVFGEAALTDPRPADSYKLSKAQCEAITALLTKEQKGYVEEMQKFLSQIMGAKGNEVSMLLYGIKMFGEENYFPIHVAGQFKAQAQESQAKKAAGFGSMSNAGFTHAQNPNAKAPFVLEGFNEVWADHVNEMSRYHGTVPALEDLRRVMNRSTYFDSVDESRSIKQLMENHFGREAVEYFDNLYREANSGAITDKLQKNAKKLLSLFRKNAVAYSLSVIIQQPASLVRAYAMIDKKYFGFRGFGAITSSLAKAVSSKWNSAYIDAYNEMLKYAPGVTMAKQIGGFDTATGGSIRSHLLDTGKSIKQKWKSGTVLEKGKTVLDVVDNNAIANLPNVADKIAWIEIWNACKRETVAKHKNLTPGSEEFMQAAGRRFTEVIRATQVYDSIFAKSPMLKSKYLSVQYIVSFMNEPNTVANMAEKAVRDAVRGNWKQGMRTGATVIYSIIYTNVLKSIIYAMRDDDEDETYIEKYIEAIVGGMMNDLNALNYIPLVKDAWSVAQGHDVERDDMAIVADAIDALNQVIRNAQKDTDDMTEEQLAEFNEKVTEANWRLAESLAAFFGIPVKNVRREIKGLIDQARIASANAGMTTPNSLWDKVTDGITDWMPFVPTKSKTDKLYHAIVSGDTVYEARLKATYKDDDAYRDAVVTALIENDPRIRAAAQAGYEGDSAKRNSIFQEIKKEGKFAPNLIIGAITREMSAIRDKAEPDKVSSDYSASDFVNAVLDNDASSAKAIRDDIVATHVANGKTQAEAEDEFSASVRSSIKELHSYGVMDDTEAKNFLVEYTGMDEEGAASRVNYWAFCNRNPKYAKDITESKYNKYKQFAEPAGVSLDVFVQYVKGTMNLEDIKDEWGNVEVTKREQVLEVIDSLPLTWQQKDALYLAHGYAESKIWDVPW